MTTLKNIVETTLVPHTAFEEAVQRVDQCFRYADGASEPICIAIIGESRTGKSRALEEGESSRPSIRTTDGLERPVLRIKTPSKPTVKGLVELMLRAMGDPKWDSYGTENAKASRLQTLMQNAKTRMVMIDEFQHFYDKGSRKVMHHVADWLKILVDESRVSLVVAGLPTCTAVLDQNEQLTGRFLSPVFIPRFNWLRDDERAEFCGVLAAFQESIGEHFDLPQLESYDMAFRFYCATGGLIGYLAKTLRQVVWDALDEDRHVISLEHLERSHKTAVWEKDGLTEIASPFCRRFNVLPNLENIAMIQTIGTRSDEDIVLSTRGRRTKASADAPLSQVLSAR